MIVEGMSFSEIAAKYQALSAYVVNHYRVLRDMYNDLYNRY